MSGPQSTAETRHDRRGAVEPGGREACPSACNSRSSAPQQPVATSRAWLLWQAERDAPAGRLAANAIADPRTSLATAIYPTIAHGCSGVALMTALWAHSERAWRGSKAEVGP
jgi:hypothetical protein